MFDELKSEARELWNSLKLELVKVGDKLGYIANPLCKLSFSYEPLDDEFDVKVDLFGDDDTYHWIALLFGEILEKFLQENCDKSVQLDYIFLSDDTEKRWMFAFSVNNLVELVEKGKIPIYKVEKEWKGKIGFKGGEF
ncbi:MAG: hypothetical protein J7K10_01830 [Thermodesulfobacterium sp.]|nr:hypothetical protein [Thermodesulfobacterium sp.]